MRVRLLIVLVPGQISVLRAITIKSGVYEAIRSFIQEFIRAPSRNLLRGASSPATAIQISLKQPAKRTFIIFRQDADYREHLCLFNKKLIIFV